MPGAPRHYPAWLETAVFYQIYPQSFRDTNADGIGDIPGITEKLPCLEELGVNALWLNPCFVSPFQDAGYDVADFRNVAPRYGTNADLVELFRRAHQRGMHVCLDLVAGHTSIEHPWFEDSARAVPGAFADRYIWTPSVWDRGDGSIPFVHGLADRDGNYATNFFYSQPALNYGFANPDPRYPWQQPVDAPGPRATVEELYAVMEYWLSLGADGFRVDMASSLIKNDENKRATIRLWKGLRARLETAFPEAVLISEWGNPTQAIAAGFHVDFMLHFGVPGYPELFFNEASVMRHLRDTVTPFFDRRGAGDACLFVGEYLRHRHATRGRGFITIPSGNHDFQRLSCGRDRRDLEIVFTFLLTWPGVPFIYYGDELGMRHLDGLPSKEGGYGRTGARTPMQWDDGQNAGFSDADPSALYLPIDPHRPFPNAASAMSDPDSLRSAVKRLLALRRKTPALGAAGDLEILYAEPSAYPFVYLRFLAGETYLVCLNPRDAEASVRIELPARPVGFDPVRSVDGAAAAVSVEPSGAAIRIAAPGRSATVGRLRFG